MHRTPIKLYLNVSAYPMFTRKATRSPRDTVCSSCLHRLRTRRAPSQAIASLSTKPSLSSSTSQASPASSSPIAKPSSVINTSKAKRETPIVVTEKGLKSRKLSIPDKRGDDFKPPVLQHALGLPERPQPGQNSGVDKRTWRQRRDDFHNYEKHLQRRKQL